MNGNTPYAGYPNVTQAGRRASEDLPELTADQKRRLRRDVARITAETRQHLPSEYAVDSDINHGASGPKVTVAVQPPVGRPVSAGFSPGEDDLDADRIVDDDDCREVARGLAASAALQVKQAVADEVTPTAR